ncbi:MAG: hypothetical protein IT427_00020 [Pirellulales bacterium]|nr:hypothetical protein [Pirellulales bacterium]
MTLKKLLALVPVLSSGLFAASLALGAEKFALRAAKPDGAPTRVVVNLEVGGHLKVASDKKIDPVPMSVVAEMGYDERRLDDDSNPESRLALRWYDDVHVVIKAADQMAKPKLREGRQLISVSASEKSVVIASPGGPLTRDELDLVEIPSNTLILDELLPLNEVAVGDPWKPSESVVTRLLLLDAVAQTDVVCRLVEVKSDVAEITIDGPVSGAIKGVASQIELKGKLTFNLKQGIATSLLLAIKEDRGVGYASPGLDVVAKLKVVVSPLPESKLLTDEVLSTAKLQQSDVPPMLEFVSKDSSYRFLYDRRWSVVGDSPQLVVMRLVDRGDLIAQCNLMPAIKQLEKPIELTQFQDDVRKALGPMFGQYESAAESALPSGLRMLKVIVAGAAEKLPIQWRYYSIQDQSGREITLAFTLEAPLAEQFRDQDKPIVESIEFLQTGIASVPTSTEQK